MDSYHLPCLVMLDGRLCIIVISLIRSIAVAVHAFGHILH